jgi:hypothetical protein
VSFDLNKGVIAQESDTATGVARVKG